MNESERWIELIDDKARIGTDMKRERLGVSLASDRQNKRREEREEDRMREEGGEMKRRRDNAGTVCRQVILLHQLPCV